MSEQSNENNELISVKDLSPQKRMVLEHKYKRFETSMQTGDLLDGKATTILQSGGFLVGLTGAVSIATKMGENPTGYALAGLAIAFLAFALMILLALWSWFPSNYKAPGTNDIDEIYKNYLGVDSDICFQQILMDVLSATEFSMARNKRKARQVKMATWLLIAQVVGILVVSIL